MKNTKTKKLSVNAQTLRTLGTVELANVAGGGDTSGCSGSFTNTGSGLCITHAQRSCQTVTSQ